MKTFQTILHVYRTELRRTFMLGWAYRLNFLSSIGLWLIAFPLMMIMFDGVAGGYGAKEQAASLVGFLTWNLCMSILEATTQSVADEVQEGTLENVLLSPFSPVAIFIIRILAGFTRQVIETLILGIALIAILQAPISMNFTSVWIIVLTMISVGGVGLALGGLALIYKKTASIVSVIALLALFFTGALIPLNDLGRIFSAMKYLLPTTWGIDLLRNSMIPGSVSPVLWQQGLGILFQAVIFLVLGIFIFQWCFRQAQTQGTLNAY